MKRTTILPYPGYGHHPLTCRFPDLDFPPRRTRPDLPVALSGPALSGPGPAPGQVGKGRGRSISPQYRRHQSGSDSAATIHLAGEAELMFGLLRAAGASQCARSAAQNNTDRGRANGAGHGHRTPDIATEHRYRTPDIDTEHRYRTPDIATEHCHRTPGFAIEHRASLQNTGQRNRTDTEHGHRYRTSDILTEHWTSYRTPHRTRDIVTEQKTREMFKNM